MNQELWRKVEELFHAALERAPEARHEFLDGACNGDSGLRRQVELLLMKEEQAGSFLEKTRACAHDGHATRPASGTLSHRVSARRWRHGRGLSRA